jgi:hypothetical protein
MENYLKDIQDIKKMMDKSSQFISLSGLSGVLAGVYALAGAIFIKYIDALQEGYVIVDSYSFKIILGVALAVLLLSVATGLLFSIRKARRVGETVWNNTSKRLITNFMIPLVTGGVFALLLIKNQYYGLIAPITLIFYGMACVNASKYTLRDVRYLGVTIIVIGLVATYFMGYGLEFWALGFGVCHILYGSMMYFKYDRNK